LLDFVAISDDRSNMPNVEGLRKPERSESILDKRNLSKNVWEGQKVDQRGSLESQGKGTGPNEEGELFDNSTRSQSKGYLRKMEKKRMKNKKNYDRRYRERGRKIISEVEETFGIQGFEKIEAMEDGELLKWFGSREKLLGGIFSKKVFDGTYDLESSAERLRRGVGFYVREVTESGEYKSKWVEEEVLFSGRVSLGAGGAEEARAVREVEVFSLSDKDDGEVGLSDEDSDGGGVVL
jgi:hypothetical protein